MIESLENFNVNESSLTLWVFRKTIEQTLPLYSARWVSISEDLENELKVFVNDEKIRYTEVIEYGFLAQNNEASLLKVGTNETEVDKIIACSVNQTPERKVQNVKHLNNCDFYAIKLVHNNDVLYCVKKTDDSWKTKKKKGLKSLVYEDYTLSIDRSPRFDIAKCFDFFILGNDILIKDKGVFESLLSYKQAHITNFNSLTIEPEFSNLFTNLAPLTAYVGNNAMQLRRASAIQQKGYYKNDAFMASLKANAQRFRLNLQFDHQNKIIVTKECCPDIFQALLDHRLQSHYEAHLYDVPNAQLV
ncbi:Kiwa anti-phage protein KwaB-like domain-containing protein [Pectobacterium punjabense]|uniref:Kiwa anti-phage protein KwaB-like domain-containing protein n=1 Tax=Pectobacterium punjabense TaxID=2108399 RepID=UPI002B24BE9D|nr:Kiwa anti-phage protein KwaB-like domain-containing protein [Pectobacterium punjabense]